MTGFILGLYATLGGGKNFVRRWYFYRSIASKPAAKFETHLHQTAASLAEWVDRDTPLEPFHDVEPWAQPAFTVPISFPTKAEATEAHLADIAASSPLYVIVYIDSSMGDTPASGANSEPKNIGIGATIRHHDGIMETLLSDGLGPHQDVFDAKMTSILRAAQRICG